MLAGSRTAHNATVADFSFCLNIFSWSTSKLYITVAKRTPCKIQITIFKQRNRSFVCTFPNTLFTKRKPTLWNNKKKTTCTNEKKKKRKSNEKDKKGNHHTRNMKSLKNIERRNPNQMYDRMKLIFWIFPEIALYKLMWLKILMKCECFYLQLNRRFVPWAQRSITDGFL